MSSKHFAQIVPFANDMRRYDFEKRISLKSLYNSHTLHIGNYHD